MKKHPVKLFLIWQDVFCLLACVLGYHQRELALNHEEEGDERMLYGEEVQRFSFAAYAFISLAVIDGQLFWLQQTVRAVSLTSMELGAVFGDPYLTDWTHGPCGTGGNGYFVGCWDNPWFPQT